MALRPDANIWAHEPRRLTRGFNPERPWCNSQRVEFRSRQLGYQPCHAAAFRSLPIPSLWPLRGPWETRGSPPPSAPPHSLLLLYPPLINMPHRIPVANGFTDHQIATIVVNSAFPALTFFFICLRLYAKQLKNGKWQLDDLLILIGFVGLDRCLC